MNRSFRWTSRALGLMVAAHGRPDKGFAAPSSSPAKLVHLAPRSASAGHLLMGLEAESIRAIAGWLDGLSRQELAALPR